MLLQTLRLESTSPGNDTESGDNGNSSGSGNSTGSPGDTYVMWMGAGEANGTFGLSAVATSGHPDGPFRLRRTLYPDGNETHDQTVYIGERGKGMTRRLGLVRHIQVNCSEKKLGTAVGDRQMVPTETKRGKGDACSRREIAFHPTSCQTYFLLLGQE